MYCPAHLCGQHHTMLCAGKHRERLKKLIALFLSNDYIIEQKEESVRRVTLIRKLSENTIFYAVLGNYHEKYYMCTICGEYYDIAQVCNTTKTFPIIIPDSNVSEIGVHMRVCRQCKFEDVCEGCYRLRNVCAAKLKKTIIYGAEKLLMLLMLGLPMDVCKYALSYTIHVCAFTLQ